MEAKVVLLAHCSLVLAASATARCMCSDWRSWLSLSGGKQQQMTSYRQRLLILSRFFFHIPMLH
jgi:hypothetical protein